MILTFAGTRPEIIKLSQIIPLLDKNFDNRFVFTGQHYAENMVDIFLEELKVRNPNFLLKPETSNFVDLIRPIENIVKKEKPETVVVYGDTNSTLAAAKIANKYKANLVHIEAGLRSFDKRMREEIARIEIDHISDILFTPTQLTRLFLDRENVNGKKFVVGNTVVDACKKYFKESQKSEILGKLGLEKEKFIFCTIHRAENVDDPEKLVKLLEGINSLQYTLVLPIHHRTRLRLSEFGYKIPSNIKAIDPVGYFDVLNLMKNSAFIITDSGGIQEEAVTLKVPCITIRETTERWETISCGANFLVGSDPILINYTGKMIIETNLKKKLSKIKNPYGEGNSSEKIVNKLRSFVK